MLDQLGYDEVDVLGISWGGGLAQQFALQNPRRCERLVLVSTSTGTLMVPSSPRTLSKMATPRRYRDPEYAASVAAQLYGGRMRREPELVKSLLHKDSRVGAGRGYVLQLAAGLGWTSLPFLPLIRQPTLLLAGTDDPLIPLVNARIMQRLMPRATLHTYDDGHLGLVTQAHELAPVIARFLRA
jgi:poly(3-hydroxyalkanoate) depolymerase